MTEQPMKTIDTEVLRIAYLEDGPQDGWPVILSHGFPYDVHAFEQDARLLAEAGARVIRPYVRGFGSTRFLSDAAMRNGQQVARALDIVQLADALRLDRPILGGFDWGANASCVVAALWPERIGGLVAYASYDIIDVAAQRRPAPPSLELACWYQHLFQSERGRECLAEHRNELCAMLWRQWSPTWVVDAAVFDRSAVAFENPDFVDVVIHNYRVMLGHADGDPALQAMEDRLAIKPSIRVPTIAIDGTVDPLKPGGTADHDSLFAGPHERRTIEAGHAVPLEVPGMFADAVRTVCSWTDD